MIETKQTSMAGTAPDIGGLLRMKSAAPIKPKKAQKACDHGLFSDQAAQLDLVQSAAHVASWAFQPETQ